MPNQQDPSLQELQRRWIRPPTAFATAAYGLLYIVNLLVRCDVPVFPMFIQKAYAAFPSGARFPRLRTRAVVRIGPALSAEQLGLQGPTAEGIHRLVETLRQNIERLQDESEVDFTPDPRRWLSLIRRMSKPL